jgi:aminomethyltransferase
VTSRSPLHAAHEAIGAKFTTFGDWEMPLQYEGTLAEHQAVRTGVGVFDVSHLGRFHVTGPGATDLVDRLLCNDLSKIRPGRTQYTMMLNPDGGIIDDIIVWWLDEDRIVVLPNGANHHRVFAAFTAGAPVGVAVEDLRPNTALVAVQGPDAPSVLEDVIGRSPGRTRVAHADDGIVVAGTGYTGERGGEVIIPDARAADVFTRLLDAGAVPCGLGARDTLRLEMGYPLWGQDLDETTTPLEAGLGWVVGSSTDFVGSEALARQAEAGVSKLLVGFVLDDRRPPRHGYALRTGSSVGTVSSGNYSPTLGRGIGMGYLSPPPEGETRLEIEIRNRWVPASITETPFVRRP